MEGLLRVHLHALLLINRKRAIMRKKGAGIQLPFCDKMEIVDIVESTWVHSLHYILFKIDYGLVITRGVACHTTPA